MNLTNEQKAAFDAVMERRDILVNATAGSGKSFFLKQVYLALEGRGIKVMTIPFMVSLYNAEIERFPNANVLSAHKRGLAILQKRAGKVKVSDGKVKAIIKSLVDDGKLEAKLSYGLDQCVAMLKNYHCVSMAEAEKILDKHFPETRAFDLHSIIYSVLVESDKDRETIDYGDMLRFPILDGYQGIYPHNGTIFIDECQDSYPVVLEFIKLYIGERTQLVMVGDIQNQMLMRFAGASEEAIHNFIDQFEPEKFKFRITFRCPSAVVDAVNQHCQTDMIAFNQGGNVTFNAQLPQVLEDLDESQETLFCCNFNAPLMRVIMERLKEGKKSKFRPKKFIEIIKRVIYRAQAYDIRSVPVGSILSKLQAWAAENEEDDPNILDAIKMTGIVEELCLAMSSQWSPKGKKKNPFIYGDWENRKPVHPLFYALNVLNDESANVNLLTSYTAKGGEWENVVYIPVAVSEDRLTEDSRKQLADATFVGYTRAKQSLTIAHAA